MSSPSVRDYAPRRYRCHPPERRRGSIQRERALRFEWMEWLRALIAGVVLALGLARVSPSGKARASQARMRGFESRHPLQKKFKAGLQFRTAPHRWQFIRGPAFLMGASRFCQLTWDIGKSTSSLVCISLSQDLPHCPRWGFVALAESYALFSQDLPWYGNPTITKTKISAFLQLFCDCGCRCSRIIHGSSFPLRESFSRGGELVTTVILGSACFPLGFVDSRNSLLNQRPREGNGACL